MCRRQEERGKGLPSSPLQDAIPAAWINEKPEKVREKPHTIQWHSFAHWSRDASSHLGGTLREHGVRMTVFASRTRR
jgi:hypothetical protein